MSKRLFGTDGIRGLAGEYPLDHPTTRKFGLGLANVLIDAGNSHPRLVVGRDTRESGEWLRDEVACGLAAGAAETVDAGVISTPGLAHAVRTGPFDAGVMISASHNPYRDNGLKVFSHDGMKLPDEVERQLEAQILDNGMEDPGERDIDLDYDGSLVESYIEYIAGCVHADKPLDGMRIMLDCSNGSASHIAPDLYRRLGAEVEAIGNDPNGTNINLDCGSLYIDRLAASVPQGGFDLGIAFDGDADRALAVDRNGRTVDGDYIIYLGARRLRRHSRLNEGKVVATIMSNFWLEKMLRDEGMDLLRAAVGDKYVLEMMLSEGAVIGGEQSGHIIYRDLSTTGDGILTGLLLLSCILEESTSLEAIVDRIKPYPQVLLNVEVREKPNLRAHPEIGKCVRQVEEKLAGTGRIVLRYSGTEPLARVMIEGEDREMVRELTDFLAAVIKEQIGL